MSEEAKPTRTLTAQDVCAILKSCHANQVVSFRFGELSVVFEHADVEHGSVPVHHKMTKKTEKRVVEETRQSLVHAELEHKRQILDQLAIEDPVAYENFVLHEDSEPEGDGESEDDSL